LVDRSLFGSRSYLHDPNQEYFADGITENLTTDLSRIRGDPTAPVGPLIEALRAAGAKQAVVTCGSRGAYFDNGCGAVHAAAVPIEVVDTCGAGDSLIATFIIEFCCNGVGAEEALYRACEAAALTCTFIGGFPQSPRPIPGEFFAKYEAAIAAGER
jgi:fructoselysine 6-kinase